MRIHSLWPLLSLLSLLPIPTHASVLAIDYGADWIKASLMKSGVPFDVLLNKDSKRKIQASVAWKKDDRLFSTDAFNLASRFPQDSFSSLKYLQAAPFDSQPVSYFTSIATAQLIESSRHTVSLRRSDGTEWSVEELIGMQFSYIKDLAETLAGEKVSDVIVTVPPYYSQYERDAVADAIEISGLKTLALINDGTAVAVNYAMTRTFPTPEYHIIYDAGASSIRATVVSFTSMANGTGTHIAVSGVGYDRQLGGNELDRRMRDILVKEFNKQHPSKDIRTDKRGMAKLWKEAVRVKAILSANNEAIATVESAAWDLDFKAKVTRATFEEACRDLKDKFADPITDALLESGLNMDKITSVILTGGSTRTPMIQSSLKAAVGEDKIALNVNADEAAVLGAALHGASLSRQFKTKNIKVTDLTVHTVSASYHSSSSGDRTISTVIYKKGSKTGSKKVLTFNRKEDFSVWLDYNKAPVPGYPTQLLEAQISGVEEALGNLTERGAVAPVVQATVQLSESGFVSVVDAVAYGEIKDDSILSKMMGLFGGKEEEKDKETEEDGEESGEHTPPRDSATASSEAASPTPLTEAEKEKRAAVLKDLSTIPLTITTTFSSIIPPMTVEEKRKARSRLRAIDSMEAAKDRKSEARNTLEAYLYRIRDLLDDMAEGSPFKKCSQEGERKAIAKKVTESQEWLAEEGDDADTAMFLDKRNAIEVLEKPIIHRYKEIEAFPSALNMSQMWNWSTRLFLHEARINITEEAAADLPSKWTVEELDALEKTLTEHERWLDEWVEKQKKVKMNEDPVIETTEMKARAKLLETALQKLVKRKVPKARKKKVESSAAPTESAAESAKATTKPEDVRDEL